MPSEALNLVLKELDRAKAKWPGWPRDPFHAAAVVATEAGELLQAAEKHTYCWGPNTAMLEEAIQTASTAIRFIEGHLAGHYVKSPDPLPMVKK